MSGTGKSGAVHRVTLTGRCPHGLQLAVCNECRELALRRVRREASQNTFANRMAANPDDLDMLIREAIPFVAATSVLEQPDKGFWMTDVLDEVMSVRNLRQFTRALYGASNALLQKAAEDHVVNRIRHYAKVRDPETNVRVYVSWRVPKTRPRRWGALQYLGIDQVSAVARDLGILGDGVQFSKDAALYLVELMEKHGPRATVNQVWDEAVPKLEAMHKAS